MLQQFLTMRLAGGGAMGALVALAGALIGGVLWLCGSRFSRSLITLLGVAVGASLGLRVPQWTGAPLSNWATAMGGAVILGASGFVFHRLWIGIALAIILTGWTAM